MVPGFKLRSWPHCWASSLDYYYCFINNLIKMSFGIFFKSSIFFQRLSSPHFVQCSLNCWPFLIKVVLCRLLWNSFRLFLHLCHLSYCLLTSHSSWHFPGLDNMTNGFQWGCGYLGYRETLNLGSVFFTGSFLQSWATGKAGLYFQVEIRGPNNIEYWTCWGQTNNIG